MVVTKWHVIKERRDFSDGYSCFYLDRGYRISKFLKSNGDLLFWLPSLSTALEISSMGSRVDENSIVSQCRANHCEGRLSLPYHQMIQKKELPYTIGGGIGQSRLCMLLLNKAHVGEVQASIWPKDMVKACEKNNIPLL